MLFNINSTALKVFLYVVIILKYPITPICDQQDRWLYLLHEEKYISTIPPHCANLLTSEISYTNYAGDEAEATSILSTILFSLQFLLNQQQFISFGWHPHYGRVVIKYLNQFENYQLLQFCSNKSRAIPKCDDDSGSMQIDLLKFLATNNFKVPTIYEVCGLIVIQSYNGEPLSNYYDYPLRDRLHITINLLKMVIQFTEGFDGFRFYPTDINPNNIAINKTTLEATLIDLDNTIVIDSTVLSSQSIAKHKIIACDNCIAFMPDEFCRHPTNDFNLFQMCQILMYDMNGKRENGFLHDLESNENEKLAEINNLLLQCYECHENSDCDNRLATVIKIINFITDFVSLNENL